jgi:hypothetical protein
VLAGQSNGLPDGDGGFTQAVMALLESGDGALWVGTLEKGLARYEEGHWAPFTHENSGLPAIGVSALLETRDSTGPETPGAFPTWS